MDIKYREVSRKTHREKASSALISQAMAYFIGNTTSAPFTVLGTSLQLSVIANKKFYGEESKEISKLLLAKSHDLCVKERQFNALQLAAGLVGENRPFRAPIYKNYREAFLALAGQGYQGFFKGNLIETIFNLASTSVKSSIIWMIGLDTYKDGGIKVLLGMAALGLGDLVCQPLHIAHTRFILQNRLPLFATYRSLPFYLGKIEKHEIYQAWAGVFPRSFGTSWAAMWISQIGGLEAIILGNLFAYSLFYPLLTVQRRLEAQTDDHTMLPRRYLGYRFAFSRIYHEEGFRSFYRGYFCNLLACGIKSFAYLMLAITLLNQNRFMSYKRDNWN